MVGAGSGQEGAPHAKGAISIDSVVAGSQGGQVFASLFTATMMKCCVLGDTMSSGAKESALTLRAQFGRSREVLLNPFNVVT